jgi:hypothetical protein
LSWMILMMRWILGIYGGKGTYNIVTTTLKSVFERGNQ